MQKVIALFLICSLFAMSSFGQTWRYSEALPSKILHRSTGVSIQQNAQDQYEISVQTENRYEHFICDSSLKLISSKLGKRHPLKGKTILYKLNWATEIIYLYSEHTSLGTQTIYSAVEKDGALVNSRIVCELQNKHVSPKEVHFKKFGENLFIWYERHSAHSHTLEEISVLNFNLSTQKLETDSFQIDVPNELIEIRDCQLTDGEKLIFFGRVYSISPIEKRAGKSNYQECLIIADKKSKVVRVESITAANVYPKRISSRIEKQMLTASYLSSNEARDQIDSIHIFKYDLANHEKVLNFSVSVESLHPPKSRLTYNQLHQKYQNLWIDHLITVDHHIILVLEFFESRIIGGAGQKTNYRYYHGPVVILQLDSNGKQEFVHHFDKNQFSEFHSSRFSSYKLALNKEGFNVIYNENRELTNFWKFLRLRRYMDKKSDLRYYHITFDGDIVQKSLSDNQALQEIALVRQTFYNSKKQLVFLFEGKKNLKIGVLNE